MQRSFTDAVNALWQAVRDTAALTALLSDLCQCDRERALFNPSSSLPAVNFWFSPLLFRLLTPEELATILPQPRTDALSCGHDLSAALLRAVLLPMRAKFLNSDVTLRLIDALEYSLDANNGIIAIISSNQRVALHLHFLPIQTSIQAMPTTSSWAFLHHRTRRHGAAR